MKTKLSLFGPRCSVSSLSASCFILSIISSVLPPKHLTDNTFPVSLSSYRFGIITGDIFCFSWPHKTWWLFLIAVQNVFRIAAAPHRLLCFVRQVWLVLAVNKLALGNSRVSSWEGENSLGWLPSVFHTGTSQWSRTEGSRTRHCIYSAGSQAFDLVHGDHF